MVGAHQLLPHEEYGGHICTDTAPYQDPACVPVIIYHTVCQGQPSISEASSRAEKGRPTPGPMKAISGLACHLASCSLDASVMATRRSREVLTEGVGNDLVDKHNDDGRLHPAGSREHSIHIVCAAQDAVSREYFLSCMLYVQH